MVRFTAGFSSTAQAVDSRDREAVAQILSPVRQNEHLDLIGAVDASGRVICRPDNPLQFADDMMGDQFVSRALRGEVVAGTTVLPVAALARGERDFAAGPVRPGGLAAGYIEVESAPGEGSCFCVSLPS